MIQRYVKMPETFLLVVVLGYLKDNWLKGIHYKKQL
ncbi:hypothetical protein BDCR2A_00711 [Borrelia duttonii CR2A]|uniref:Uncharacterized protein n=1 Tax=Borrelia duttonii CR2A TaxID=1432657 RepID=W6TJ94_9SPIR|nr:hypothetical protein BDCR2A_00711 [Borrelia duttonii CR2A]